MAFLKSTNIITGQGIFISSGITGGSDGKVVYVNGIDTVADANTGLTATQLNTVMLKKDNKYHIEGVITGFTGLSSGSPYFLAASGNITTTPPVPSTTTRALYVGFAINTTDLYFRPGIPISG